MAYQLTALFHHPRDVEAFDRYYDETHAPLAAKLPGLRTFTVCRPGPDADGKPPLYHVIAILTWDSEEAFQAALGSAEGQATVADVANFAQAGVEFITGVNRLVVQ